MKSKLGAAMLSAYLVAVPFATFASDNDPSTKAHQHYRCSALVELSGMTDADQKVCDKLKMSDFDLAAWESTHQDQSIKLHEEVFSEFF